MLFSENALVGWSPRNRRIAHGRLCKNARIRPYRSRTLSCASFIASAEEDSRGDSAAPLCQRILIVSFGATQAMADRGLRIMGRT